jgi:CRP/FNR family transcriptional regulator/CRP/FNR family cyclic AMP-dependent transcriptional regulator
MLATPVLGDVPEEDIRKLIDRGAIRQFRRGTYLLHQGEKATEVLFLWEGRVEISSLSSTGHRQLHSTIEPPQFIGEFGVLGDMPRTATALALQDSMVWAISAEEYLEFLDGQPAATRELLRALARQIQAHETLVEDLLSLDLKGRVAKRLLGLVSNSFDELPADGAMVPSIVTHADLASLSGGSRENVTRILSEFQRRGLVERVDRRYRLKDVSGLKRLAGL